MKKRILDYNRKISQLISDSDNSNNTDWLAVKDDLLIQISFFQHERLIHLIVTVTFAIMTLISVALVLLTNNTMTIFLFLAIMCLLVPYIKHYYLLENEVQRMYSFYDAICLKFLD